MNTEDPRDGAQLDDTLPTLIEPPRPAAKADLAALKSLVYYRFRIAHTEVALDTVAYVGRRPSGPRISTGRKPRLVRVPSPLREVSSTHIEIRQTGTSVVVTDLRSTNGSTVVVPGNEPTRLLQGASIVVSPGTLIDIGDGNVIEILSMLPARLAAAAPGHQEGSP